MRTTVDLPAAVHRRAQEIARQRGESLSSVVAQLAARGLIALDEPAEIVTDPRSGLPTISVGRRVTSDEVDTALDDE